MSAYISTGDNMIAHAETEQEARIMDYTGRKLLAVRFDCPNHIYVAELNGKGDRVDKVPLSQMNSDFESLRQVLCKRICSPKEQRNLAALAELLMEVPFKFH